MVGFSAILKLNKKKSELQSPVESFIPLLYCIERVIKILVQHYNAIITGNWITRQ